MSVVAAPSVVTAPSEWARQLARSMMPRPLFMFLARLYTSVCGIHAIGWKRWRDLQKTIRGLPEAEHVQFEFPNLTHPISIRPGTSDGIELVHTVVRECYGEYLPRGSVRLIVDAGANIGDSTSWYLSRFADARVVAIEPARDTFALLKQNIQKYGSRGEFRRIPCWR